QADAMLRAIFDANSSDHPPGLLEVAWHLSAADFALDSRDRLLAVAQLAADGLPVEFCFDRPRRPILLGAGLTRNQPAVLIAVGVHLPKLADLTPAATPERFLEKLGTLARLARSVG